jgi:hypothetical protein
VSEDALAGLADRIEQLRQRLEGEELDAAQTTELLDEITRLAQEALEEIERRAEALDTPETSP